MRLGRLVEHDERSRAYRVQRYPGVLKSVEWKRNAPVADQGELGSCTCEALVSTLAADPMYRPFHKRYPRVSLDHSTAERLYRSATRLDEFAGAWPPDDTGSSGLAACKAARRAGYISSYRWCFGIEDVLSALMTGPVMIGVNWYDDMFSPDNDGRLMVGGRVAGGHEVCLTGLDFDNYRVWLTNSWGPSWGVGGRAWLAWTALERLLGEQGDAVVPMGPPRCPGLFDWIRDLFR